jgi:hypothetical protein
LFSPGPDFNKLLSVSCFRNCSCIVFTRIMNS